MTNIKLISENELYHHGILGMKWGIRRYQNKDGTLTAAGKKRYGTRVTQDDIDSYKKVVNQNSYNSNKRDRIGYAKTITAIQDEVDSPANQKTIEYSIAKANAAITNYNKQLDKAYKESMDEFKNGNYRDTDAYESLKDMYISLEILNNPKNRERYKDWTDSEEDRKKLNEDVEKISDKEMIEYMQKVWQNNTHTKEYVTAVVHGLKYKNDRENDYLDKAWKERHHAINDAESTIFNVGKQSVNKILSTDSFDISELPDRQSFGDMEIVLATERMVKEYSQFANWWLKPYSYEDDDYPSEAYVDARTRMINDK